MNFTSFIDPNIFIIAQCDSSIRLLFKTTTKKKTNKLVFSITNRHRSKDSYSELLFGDCSVRFCDVLKFEKKKSPFPFSSKSIATVILHQINNVEFLRKKKSCWLTLVLCFVLFSSVTLNKYWIARLNHIADLMSI